MSDVKEFESDHRLPSGEWTGFYLEPMKTNRGWMHLYIEFAGSEIRGEGTDYVGPWNLTGKYDLESGVCQWVKQYIGQHQVKYTGLIGENGIQGDWNMREWYTGAFHIWPRDRSDLQQLYMEDDLSQMPPTIQLGSTPIDSPLL